MGAEKHHDNHDDADDDVSISIAPPGGHKVEEGEGPWLVSYADLMTLLMGFFALMLSFSKFDDQKFDEVRQESSKLFGGEYQKPFEELKSKLQVVIESKGLTDQVTVDANSKGVGITFRGTVFFDAGLVEPRKEAISLMKELVPVIKAEAGGFYVLTEGHTDDTPISQGVISSNWELSALRASSITRIFETAGFDRSKLLAIGWSDTKPLLSNRTEDGSVSSENQAKNRRVVIQILKSAPLD
jgi:chemotaxis protein MotB